MFLDELFIIRKNGLGKWEAYFLKRMHYWDKRPCFPMMFGSIIYKRLLEWEAGNSKGPKHYRISAINFLDSPIEARLLP